MKRPSDKFTSLSNPCPGPLQILTANSSSTSHPLLDYVIMSLSNKPFIKYGSYNQCLRKQNKTMGEHPASCPCGALALWIQRCPHEPNTLIAVVMHHNVRSLQPAERLCNNVPWFALLPSGSWHLFSDECMSKGMPGRAQVYVAHWNLTKAVLGDLSCNGLSKRWV